MGLLGAPQGSATLCCVVRRSAGLCGFSELRRALRRSAGLGGALSAGLCGAPRGFAVLCGALWGSVELCGVLQGVAGGSGGVPGGLRGGSRGLRWLCGWGGGWGAGLRGDSRRPHRPVGDHRRLFTEHIRARDRPTSSGRFGEVEHGYGSRMRRTTDEAHIASSLHAEQARTHPTRRPPSVPSSHRRLRMATGPAMAPPPEAGCRSPCRE